jgi:purine nucleoside permease
MIDKLKKWWNRKWGNWKLDSVGQKYYTQSDNKHYIILKRTSNDGLVEFKRINK